MSEDKKAAVIEAISSMTVLELAELVKEMTEQMEALGKEKIKAENEKLRPPLEKMLSRKRS